MSLAGEKKRAASTARDQKHEMYIQEIRYKEMRDGADNEIKRQALCKKQTKPQNARQKKIQRANGDGEDATAAMNESQQATPSTGPLKGLRRCGNQSGGEEMLGASGYLSTGQGKARERLRVRQQ